MARSSHPRRDTSNGSRLSAAYDSIYSVVRRVPSGRVATYGQVAQVAGLPGRARQVGYALHALPKHTAVPWHRVVNAAGMISRRGVSGPEIVQRQRLEREGVTFDARGRIDVKAYGWRPRKRSARST